MNIELRTIAQAKSITEPLVIFCKKGSIQLSTPSAHVSPESKEIVKQLEESRLTGTQVIQGTPETIVHEIAEPKGLDTTEHLRIASYRVSVFAQKRKNESIALVLPKIKDEALSALCQGFLTGGYSFTGYKSEPTEQQPVTLVLYVDGSEKRHFQKIVDREITLGLGATVTRDLINEPGSSLTPKDFVTRAKKLAAATDSIEISIRDKKALAKEGFNGLITVGKGSPNDPYMVTLNYTHSKAPKTTKLALVGKGITFDTGGISLKPAGSMWEMRMDMGGAGTVLGAFKAIAELKLPINVSAVICLAENRPGQDAALPGDIFTAKNGKTIQVENTDAEGRLVLTDGLAEAGLIGATHIIDLATLTGAIVRAIGPKMTGLFSNKDAFATTILKSGKANGEKFWHMPLEEEYRDELDDKVADLRNISESAGAITAGLFLQEFVPEGAIWAHLDIAGTAFITKEWKYYNWGATGWGVRSLVSIAESLTKK
ncbi:MAG: leucyl aminopeptidase [Fibrobacterales bacterium]